MLTYLITKPTIFRIRFATIILLCSEMPLGCFPKNGAYAQTIYQGLPIITNFTTEEYKGGIQNWDFTQGERDLLFVANNFGVLVYDGEQWSTLAVTDATRILSVANGANGTIYIGGQGDFGCFRANKRGTLQYTSFKKLLPERYQNFNEVWEIFTLGEAIYFFTFKYIFKYEKGEIEVIDPETPLGFSFKVRNQLFTYVPSKGLMQLEGGQLNAIRKGSIMKGKELRGMVPYDMTQTLLATRKDGLYLMANGTVEEWEVPINSWLKEAQINTLRLLSSNLYAIGTQNGGLIIVNAEGKVIHALSKERGLVSSTILSLYEDRLGNLWAGLNNGIAFIELGKPFTLINDNMNLPGTGYAAFQTGSSLFLGTNNGVFTFEVGKEQRTLYTTFEKVPYSEGQTYSIQKYEGTLLLGHHQGGFEIKNGKAERIESLPQGIWKFEAIPGSTEKLIAGAYDGIYLLERKDNRWVVLKKYEGFEESSRKFEWADSTTLWMTHGYKGVYKLTFSSDYMQLANVRFYGMEAGFPSNLLINVFRVENRLVFAAERDFFEYDTTLDRFVMDTVLSAYFQGKHVRELKEDIQGNLYFIADDEIGMLRKTSAFAYEKITNSFQKVGRYISDDLENITVVDAENVFINAKEGFIHYNPSQPVVRSADFSTVLRSVTWGDSTLFGGYHPVEEASGKSNKRPALPYSKQSVRIRYACTYFEGDTPSEYQYWLDGFDASWSEWSTIPEKEYTNLPPGEYTFQVRSRNSSGAVSAPAAYLFKVMPPWYQTTLAYAVYLTIGLLAVSVGIWSIDRKYKKQQRNLMETTQKAIEERETQLQEVTEQSEKEISKLRNEQLKSELRHKNQELASATMHLITKNEFMNFLKLEISHLMKEEDPKAMEKGLRRLVKTIEKNIAEDEAWNQFEIHFDQVHGDFIKKLREQFPALTPQEVKISAFLRMNMTSKEIAQLLNISVRGVEVSRYRLRKKLPIETQENLVDFMMKVE